MQLRIDPLEQFQLGVRQHVRDSYVAGDRWKTAMVVSERKAGREIIRWSLLDDRRSQCKRDALPTELTARA